MWYKLSITDPLDDYNREKELTADEWLRTVQYPISAFFDIFVMYRGRPIEVERQMILRMMTRQMEHSLDHRFLSAGDCISDSTNNLPKDVEAGNIIVDLIFKPYLTVHFFKVRMAKFEPLPKQNPVESSISETPSSTSLILQKVLANSN